MSTLERSIDLAEELFDTYPILVYPCRMYNRSHGQLRSPNKEELLPDKKYAMFYDLGVYGVPGPVKRKGLTRNHKEIVKKKKRKEKILFVDWLVGCLVGVFVSLNFEFSLVFGYCFLLQFCQYVSVSILSLQTPSPLSLYVSVSVSFIHTHTHTPLSFSLSLSPFP